MLPFDNHFWMLIILCFVPVVTHFFKKPAFFNSSFYNGIFIALILTLIKFLEIDSSGTASTVIFIVFLIIPLFLQKKISEHILNNEFKKARSSIRLVKVLCPVFPSKNCREIISLMEKDLDEISPGHLKDCKPVSIPALIAASQMHFLKTEWSASDEWLKQFDKEEIKKNPWLTMLYLRVLCETNRFSEALEFTKEVKETQNQYFYFIYHLVYLSSFFGERKLLKKLFSLPVKELKEDNKNFWQALCEYKSTDTSEQGKAKLELIAESDNLRLSQSSKAALKNETRLVDNRLIEPLNTLSAELFENLEDYLGPLKRKTFWTNTFLILNLLIYLISRPDKNPDFPLNNISQHLILFLPESLESQQWWRFLTTTFLHGSFLHFVSNMLMLLIFGYMVESYFKNFKIIFIYLGAGIAGMAVVAFNHEIGTRSMTLGASGSTMALMGAYIAVLLRQNKRSSVKLRKQQLIFLFALIVIQSRIDLISPQISFTAHIVGLVFGLISAYILYKPLYADLETKSEYFSD